jgi:hypothetical protein
MSPLKVRLILTVVLCFSSATAIATSFTPARIGNHNESLAKMISFPDGVDGNVSVFLRCEAKVYPGGTIDEAGCYGDESTDPLFFRAVNLGSESASMMPATVDGEQVPVLALFTVMFKQQNGERLVAVIPNHGTNVKSLGLNYIAPQRFGRGNVYQPRTDLGLLWLDAIVSDQGKPSGVEYIDTEWTNRETERYAQSYIKDNRFIPGFLDGVPTSMRFVKPIFGYKNGFMVHPIDSKCQFTEISCDESSGATGKPRFAFDD